MFYYLLVFIHLFICIGLVFFVLIQSNKGMGLSGAFGAMGAGDSVFGSSGGVNILMKITIALSLLFTVSTLALTVVTPPSREGGIIAEEYANRPQSTSDLIDQTQAAGDKKELPADASQGNATPATQ